MTQNEGTAAKTEGIEAQVRVNLAYAALNRLKDLGNNVFKEVRPFVKSPIEVLFRENHGPKC